MNQASLDILLARMLEGGHSIEEARQLGEMVSEHPELREVLASLVELEGVEAAGTMDALTPEELAGALEAIRVASEASSELADDQENGEDNDIDDRVDRNASDSDSLSGGEEITLMSTSPRDRQDAIDRMLAEQSAEGAPETIGKPPADDLFSVNVSQDYADDCAIKCQELILQEYGIEVSSGELYNTSITNGWYMPGIGTPMEDVGKLLEAKGLEVNTYTDANIFNLVNELAQGHRVIIAVDSGELWSSNEVMKEVSGVNPELYEDGVADHAVIVSGVDISDPANPLVVVTDPGTGQIAATYPLADFLEAWEDSGFTMYSTNTSPEQFALDHVDSIGEIPYETFVSYYPQVAYLSAGDNMFGKLCETFRENVRDPLSDSVGDLLDSFSIASSAPADTISQAGIDVGAELADASDADDDDEDGDLV